MLEKRLAGHFFTEVGQPVGIHVQIRLVDLENVAGEYHFCPFSGPCDDGLYFMRSQVLGFIDYEIHFPQAAPADIGQRGYEQFFFIQHGIDPVCLPAPLLETAADYVEVVHERLDERAHLAFLVARQETYLLVPEYHGRPGEDDLVIVPFLFKSCGEGQQGLSCPCPSGERNQSDIWVQTCVQRELLFVVARGNPVGAAFLDQDDSAAGGTVPCTRAV